VAARARYYEDQGSPETADRWVTQVETTFDFLAANPGVGLTRRSRRRAYAHVRVARVEGFETQLVVYREVEGGIEVLRVLAAGRTSTASSGRRDDGARLGRGRVRVAG
jgi:plasmid stabilization system protein ParE